MNKTKGPRAVWVSKPKHERRAKSNRYSSVHIFCCCVFLYLCICAFEVFDVFVCFRVVGGILCLCSCVFHVFVHFIMYQVLCTKYVYTRYVYKALASEGGGNPRASSPFSGPAALTRWLLSESPRPCRAWFPFFLNASSQPPASAATGDAMPFDPRSLRAERTYGKCGNNDGQSALVVPSPSHQPLVGVPSSRINTPRIDRIRRRESSLPSRAWPATAISRGTPPTSAYRNPSGGKTDKGTPVPKRYTCTLPRVYPRWFCRLRGPVPKIGAVTHDVWSQAKHGRQRMFLVVPVRVHLW